MLVVKIYQILSQWIVEAPPLNLQLISTKIANYMFLGRNDFLYRTQF